MGGTELRLSSTALMATTSMTVAKHWSKKRTGSVDLYRSVGYVAKIPAVGRLFSSSGLEILTPAERSEAKSAKQSFASKYFDF